MRSSLLVVFTRVLLLTSIRSVCNMADTIRDGSHVIESSILCKNYPGLTRTQSSFCRRFPDTMYTAFHGLHGAVAECQWQLQKHRWNCSSLDVSIHKNPFNQPIVAKGFRESAFVNALLAAGMMTEISRACALGSLRSCGCQPEMDSWNGVWKWNNCETNLQFASRFTRRFIDKRHVANDLPYRSHFHNSRVGRRAVKAASEMTCKCHGLSGSCQVETCWKMAPSLRKVGSHLMTKYHNAVMIDNVNSVHVVLKSGLQRTPIHKSDLVYYELSPSYCDADQTLDVSGTTGRLCYSGGTHHLTEDRVTTGGGGGGRGGGGLAGVLGHCETLCCGRGYNVIPVAVTQQCHCQFHWCCRVMCKQCHVADSITVCK